MSFPIELERRAREGSTGTYTPSQATLQHVEEQSQMLEVPSSVGEFAPEHPQEEKRVASSKEDKFKEDICKFLLNCKDPIEEEANYQSLCLVDEDTEENCSIYELLQQKKKIIFIQGEAGTGKSELCRYIRRRWKNEMMGREKHNLFSNIKYLFLVPVRELSRIEANDFFIINMLETLFAQNETWGNYIQSDVIENRMLLQQALQDILKSDEALIIFDGYDERRLSQNENYIINFFKEVSRRLMPISATEDSKLSLGSNIIITSRPLALHEFSADFKLVNKGFSKETKKAYISGSALKAFDVPKDSLMKIVQNEAHSLFAESNIPFILKMLCEYFTNPRNDTNITLVDLYDQTLSDLISAKENQDVILSILSNLAYEKLTQSAILFSKQDIEEQFAKQEFDCLSLAREDKGLSVFRRTRQGDQFAFSHLTLQEFLAAKFLFHNFNQEKTKIEQHCRDERYCKVWVFLSGLFCKNNRQEEFAQLFQLLKENQREVFGQKKHEILLSCIDAFPVYSEDVNHYLEEIMINQFLISELSKSRFFFSKKNISKKCGEYVKERIRESPNVKTWISIWGGMEIDLHFWNEVYRNCENVETKKELLDVALKAHQAWEKSEDFDKCQQVLEFIRENYQELPDLSNDHDHLRKNYFMIIFYLTHSIVSNQENEHFYFFLEQCKEYACPAIKQGSEISQLQKFAMDALNEIVRCARKEYGDSNLNEILDQEIEVDLCEFGYSVLEEDRESSNPFPALQIGAIELVTQSYQLNHLEEVIGWFFRELKNRYLASQVRGKICKCLVELFDYRNREYFLRNLGKYLAYANLEKNNKKDRNDVRWDNFSLIWKGLQQLKENLIYGSDVQEIVKKLALTMQQSKNASIQKMAIDLFVKLGLPELEKVLKSFTDSLPIVQKKAAETFAFLINESHNSRERKNQLWNEINFQIQDSVFHLYLLKFIEWEEINHIREEVARLLDENRIVNQDQLEVIIEMFCKCLNNSEDVDFFNEFSEKILEIAIAKECINSIRVLSYRVADININYFFILVIHLLGIALNKAHTPFLRECVVRSLAYNLPVGSRHKFKAKSEELLEGITQLLTEIFIEKESPICIRADQHDTSVCFALIYTLEKWINMLSQPSTNQGIRSIYIKECWKKFEKFWKEFFGSKDFSDFLHQPSNIALFLDFLHLQSVAKKHYKESELTNVWEQKSLATKQNAITTFSLEKIANQPKSQEQICEVIDFLLQNLSPSLGDLGYREVVVKLGELVSRLRNDQNAFINQFNKFLEILNRLMLEFRITFFESIYFSDHCKLFVKVYEYFFMASNFSISNEVAHYIIKKGKNAFLSVSYNNSKKAYYLQVLNEEIAFKNRENAKHFESILKRERNF